MFDLKDVLMALGYYKPGRKYWINIDKIHITDDFAARKIGKKKMERKLEYYGDTGEFESKVILDGSFTLTDGYSTYQIINEFGTGKVPVWFKY